ncbi:MAG: hypothetical protein HXX08_18955 [Chloroflexi bacterium]|uniref:DUF5666 domain-containing protein n=1 Tax=Candidatus Chlorohelix allophototropha TaxID=3003348 RepID=A0A8T7M745_9CHLR|nr:hypothetical protein [Chloroflexota bacterium]WJW69843.1 DUF5666 domain-containing protein [Chloroflexota bacterium L227-S17]
MKRKENGTIAKQGKNKRFAKMFGGAALVATLAFGGGSILNSNTTLTYAQTAPAATPSSSDITVAPTTDQSTQVQHGMKDRQGGRGQNPDRAGELEGAITSISGNTITLKSNDATIITATVDSTTTYTEAGKTITLAGLKVGERVHLKQTGSSNGIYTVSAVEVELNHDQGTVTAVSSDSLTITRADNSTLKVVLNSNTTYTDLGKTINQSDLKSGVKVEVEGNLNSDGNLEASVIEVEHDRLGGTVTAINGNSITIQVDGRDAPGGGRKGQDHNKPNAANNGTVTTSTATTKTITVDSSTTYSAAGQSVQLSAIAVGSRVDAEGTLSSDSNSLTALQVNIQMPEYRGQVTAVDGSTITLQDRNGTRTIEINSSTKYLNGTTAATLSDVKVGTNLEAEGQVDSSGKMTASLIQLGQPQQGPGGGHGHGR